MKETKLKSFITGTVAFLVAICVTGCGEKESALIVPKNEDAQRAALVQRAHEAGLHEDPEVVREIESLLIAKLKEEELQPEIAKLSVSDEEAENYLQANPAVQPEELQIAALWFNTRGQKPLVERYQPRLEDLQPLIVDLPASEGFGQHAMTNSEHKASRFKGGNLGWIRNSESTDPWKQCILNLATNLQPGELSPITANEHGLFLVRLLDRREPSKPSLASIKQKLLRQKRSAAEYTFLQN